MNRIILLIIILSSTHILNAQNKLFAKQAEKIAQRIDSITISEKNILKKELKKIDKKLKNREISVETAEAEKKRVSEYHAKKINEAIALQEQKLKKLVRNKVNGNLKNEGGVVKRNRFVFPYFEENYVKDSVTGLRIEKRWTTQFVVAFGANKVLNDGGDFYGDGFKISPLGYGEVGFAFKYRLKEDSNLLNLKLGFSTMVNDMRPNRTNDILVTNGGQTTLQDSGLDIIRSKFSSLYIAIPVHLEFDFSEPKYNKKTKQIYLHSQEGFRMGFGGFFGLRLLTYQHIRYNDNSGKRIRLRQNDDFNMNTFSFGPSAYIGYKYYSLYVKYDANSIFKNNPNSINNLAIGLRFDFN